MKDYFENIKEYAKMHYNLIIKKEEYTDVKIGGILANLQLDENAKYIYEHYKSFDIVWHNTNNRYIGCIKFVSCICLDEEHKKLIEIMDESYDVDSDELEITEYIIHWYPLFYFPNGDAFCLDTRDRTIVFYEHDIYDGEKNLHGLLIAKSISELFAKWSSIHFADIYDWTDVVNDDGIDLSCDMIKQFM